MDSFEIDTCPQCQAESYCYNIKGVLVFNGGKIFVNNGSHKIPLAAWFESFNFKHGTKVKISIERIIEE